jgi:hypothetical protein
VNTLKRRIEQLINGRYEYETPKVLLSETSIVVETKAGENVKGNLHIGLEKQHKLKGIATSTHRRFLLGKERFSGNAVCIPYGVDVKGLHPQDVCEGEVILSTNLGEYRIPFRITVTGKQMKSSAGAIDSMDAFVALVREDYREAFRLFVDDSFSLLLHGQEANMYRAVSRNPVTYQHLEEFLIGIHKKEAVRLSLEEDHMQLYEVQSSLKEELHLKRSGWGYLRAEISVVGDFLEVEKKVITADDFIGSTYSLEYIVHRERMGEGKNYGKILIRTVYETLVYEVMASRNHEIQVNVSAFEKKRQIELAQWYLDLVTHKISYRNWYENTREQLEDLVNNGYGEPLYQLMLAYVYQSAEEGEKSDEILDIFKESPELLKGSPELEGFYLYICKLMYRLPKEKSNIVPRMHYLYQRQEDSFLLLWILMQIDEELNRTLQKKMYVLERQYEIGCRSPFLYVLACQILQQDGSLIRKLNGFYIQVLRFAKKQGMFTEEMAFRVSFLAGNRKTFSQPVYEILSYVYEEYPSKDTLEVICKLIMLGEPRKPEYFIWYERAVEQEIKITRLYEYYIETMSRNYNKVLPQLIRMYFYYNNTLSDKKKAFVYANVIRNKALDKTTYQSYRTAMEAFARAKLLEGRINEDFAVLYQEFCMNIQGLDGQEALAKVLFTHRVYVDDPKVRKIVVCHSALREEQSYPCNEGTAYISLYTEDACIVFEDEKRRRYISTVDYNLQKLLEGEEAGSRLLESHVNNSGLLLAVCGESVQDNAVTPENLFCYQQILESEEFEDSYKQQVRGKVMEFYREHKGTEDLTEPLAQLDFDVFAQVNKGLLIDVLVSQGMYVGAYDLLCEYGYEGVDSTVLLRLCSRMILNLEFEYEEELLLLAHYIFQNGKYDEVILQYLVKVFEGPVDQMLEIYKSAKGFQMEAYELAEKILIWSMFTRVYRSDCAKVLKDYRKQAGKDQVVLAYLTFASYGYFMDEKDTDPYIFRSLEFIVDKQWEMDVICQLALLKYYADRGNCTEEELPRINHMLVCCNGLGLRFAFMKGFPEASQRLCQIEDKMFVEYKGKPYEKVVLHYTTGDQEDRESWKREPLKNCYQGIFHKEFILFYGEVLTYYFEVEKDGTVENTEVSQVLMEEVSLEGNSKYQMLNRMLAAWRLGKEKELEDTLKEYRRQEAIIRQVFQIIE